MVNGSFKMPKQKPTLPPELRGGKIGAGWYEDSICDSRIANKEEHNGREEMDQGSYQASRKTTP
jgi:hypothetical protein